MMNLNLTDAEVEGMFERAMRAAMDREQTLLTVQRYLYGDLTPREGIDELFHQRKLIEAWTMNDPSPFGEID